MMKSTLWSLLTQKLALVTQANTASRVRQKTSSEIHRVHAS